MRMVCSDAPADTATLVDLLRWRAAQQPAMPAYAFLADDGGPAEQLTFAALDQLARAIAAALRERCAPGERALLLYPPGLSYLAAFFGCLYAGVVAVPAYPPNPARLARTLPRLRAIAGDAGPAVALTTSALAAAAAALASADPAFAGLRWLATDTLDVAAAAGAWQPPAIAGNTPAFLQYTSGSTAQPRGVIVGHANLLHNLALIAAAFGHTPGSRGVIWLPPYHDMGLIGGLLQPLYAGFPVQLMAPVAFLQRPLRWLAAISEFAATTSGGPNFAYDLCVRAITPEQRATLDLHSWRVAFNGAEPVRAATLQRFAEAFGPCGFQPAALYPCYGLAEATLIVSGGVAGQAPVVRSFAAEALARQQVAPAAAGRALVSSGRPLGGQALAIVDPASRRRCPAGAVGEIWLAGPSVAQGYWGQPVASAATFAARIAGEPGGPYLRTGDLGFLDDGELFVTGRRKDLIIIRGRNHYPQDLEQTAERSHPAVRAGSGAAFTIERDGAEQLVLVYELAREQRHADPAAVAAAIRQALAAEHELATYAVALIKPGSIPKTSSGKIQRYACREAFLNGTLELLGTSVLAHDAAADPATPPTRALLLAAAPAERAALLNSYLRALLAAELGATLPAALSDLGLGQLGLDSLQAATLQHRLEADLGLDAPMTLFLDDRPIGELVRKLLAQLDAPAPPAAPAPPQAATPGAHPLAAGQRALWFLHRLAPGSAAYNLSSAVRVHGTLDLPALQRALAQLVALHPILGARIAAHGDEPLLQPGQHFAFELIDLPEAAAARDAQLAALAHQPFDLAHGPLLRIYLSQPAPGQAVCAGKPSCWRDRPARSYGNTGAPSWPTCRRRSSCRPTGRARRCRGTRA
jgi:acyl-CoA synthetase (AMP-forming)/AMP-acid ligase II